MIKKLMTRPISGLQGTLTVPGDKSLSHRGLILGAISQGTTTLHHFLPAADCLSHRGLILGAISQGTTTLH
ncbi:hypothetical protein EUZ87_08645, partial [Lactiplantibacillus paraplantarum]